MRTIPEIIYGFLRKEEAVIMRVYDDANPKKILEPGYEPVGTLTAGIGHVSADLHPGMTITVQMVDRWLREDVRKAAAGVNALVKPDVLRELTDHQYAALISFVFNIGIGALSGSTLLKRVNARQFDQVPIELMKWVNMTVKKTDPATGKVVKRKVKVDGLVRRRAAEVQMWSTPEPGSTEDHVPSSVTRVVDTPPTPSEPNTNLAKDPAVLAGSGGLVSGAVATVSEQAEKAQPILDAASQVNDVLSPWAWVINLLAAIPDSVRMMLLGMAMMLAMVALYRFYRTKRTARL